MDVVAQSANRSRSLRGSGFEDKIEGVLIKLKNNKRIKGFVRKPKVYDGEFNPDFAVEKNDGTIVSIDSTTTARTDRLRGKQWDAYGTKNYFKEVHKKDIKSVVVVDEVNTSQKEKDNFRRCKDHCRMPHSALDDTFSVEELVTYLSE